MASFDRLFNPKLLNPLAKSLLEEFGKDRRGRRMKKWAQASKTPFSRSDITDEKACDDIIKYLAPTLEQHKGCAIIDVAPGACLFSSKLHDFLRPERHLLMEPEEKYVERYIQPLLDKPGSTYRHTYLHGAHPLRYWESYKQILEDPSLLPTRPTLPRGDPALRQFDPSLLVIGNLSRSYATRRIETTLLMAHQMSYGVLANEHFQRSGLVRMLWWIPERLKNQVMTRNTYLRTAFSANVEMGVEPREVAGVTSINDLQDATTFGRKRAAIYNRTGIDQVAARMEQAGMAAPKGRELLGIEYDGDVKVSRSAHKSPFDSKVTTVPEFQAKIKNVRERLQEVSKMPTGATNIPNDSPGWALLKTMEYPQSQAVIDRYTEKTQLSKHRAPLVLDVSLRVLNLEASYKDLEDRSQDRENLDMLKTEILKLDEDLAALAKKYGVHQAAALQDLNEEQIAFYMQPQHTPWERRPFEPLKLSSSDFFPPTSNLALMDFIPKTRDLSVPDLADNKEGVRICAEMIRHLFSARLRSVVDALNSFAVNAGQDLVPMVPAITDVRRGGRLNPQKVQVRMLTEEMIEGLVKAFFEWPFRPQTWQLTALNETEAVSGDAEAEGDGGEAVAAER